MVLQTMAYRLNEETGIIDYDMLEKTATLYRPKLLVAGASAYPRCSACPPTLPVSVPQRSALTQASLRRHCPTAASVLQRDTFTQAPLQRDSRV